MDIWNMNGELGKAVLKGDLAHAQELLHMGASPDSHDGRNPERMKDPCYRSVLMCAAQAENPAMLALLLSFNPKKLDLCDTEGMTALHHAVILERWHAVDMLLDAGARIDARGGYGMEPPPLHTAIYMDQRDGHLRRTKYLLEKGASALSSNNGGRTAFDIATPETREVLANHVHRMAERKLKKIEDIANKTPSAITIRKPKPRQP